MAAPLVPSPLDYVGRRRFTFYPPIRGVDTNEWLLGMGSRTEVQVVNARTGQELWVPRQYIGAVSDSSGALAMVGLTKDLELRGGAVEPRFKGVIEMPRTAPSRALASSERRLVEGPATVVGIRLEDRSESPMNKALMGALVVCVLAALLAAVARF